MSRVVVHYDAEGILRYLADDGVTVYVVDERAPGDRIYRPRTEPIPAGTLDGPVGHAGDGSPAALRAELAAELAADDDEAQEGETGGRTIN